MQDLEVINRTNAEAVQRSIPSQLSNGYWVVEERAGLHFIGTHSFKGDTPEGTAEERAKACLNELNASGNSTSAILHAPYANAGIGRDDGSTSDSGAVNADHLAQRVGYAG